MLSKVNLVTNDTYRIHYPLPLPYVGKPDPVQLQETIRKLREENQRLKEQASIGRSLSCFSWHLVKGFTFNQHMCFAAHERFKNLCIDSPSKGVSVNFF